jgi:ABC-2 type transport system ATP-binding protein
VVFLDEPTTGLDPRARQTMWAIIDRLVAGGTTILLTTQYLDEAERLADRIAVLADGRIIAEGTPAELKQRIPGEQVALGFASADSLEAAVVAIADPVAAVDREALTIRVATDGSPAAVRTLLDRVGDAGVVATSLDLHRPTLDDVFFLLTGQPTADLAGRTDRSDRSDQGADA